MKLCRIGRLTITRPGWEGRRVRPYIAGSRWLPTT